MSWDVLIVKPKDGPLPAAKLTDETEMVPLGDAQKVRDAVSRVLPGVNWRDLAMGYYRSDGFSIEFNHEREGIATNMMLHVRGGGNPLPAIVQLCKSNGWAAYDTSSDAYLDLDAPSPKGWQEFKGYRDSVLGKDPSSPSQPERPPWMLLIVGIPIVAVAGLLLWRQRRMQ